MEVKTPLDKEISKVVERINTLKEDKRGYVSAINDALKTEETKLKLYAKSIREGIDYVEDIEYE